MTKILIIEDEHLLLTGLEKLLKIEGYEVITADNGLLGVELAIRENPQLIICDLMMPELDGYGVLRCLRDNPITASTPFICLTAKDERNALRQMMVLGANDFLTKPFSRKELLEAIKSQLNQRKRLQEEIVKVLTPPLNSPNLSKRVLLQEKFQQILLESSFGNTILGIVLIHLQLDKFRESLGEDFTDVFIENVIEKIENNVLKNSSNYGICELKGQQIALILPPVMEKEEVIYYLEQISELLSRPVYLMGFEIVILSYIGVALYPEHSEDFEQLLINANIAVQQAKKQTLSNYSFYSKEKQLKSRNKLMLEMSLRQAIQQEQFELYYQPKLSLKDGTIKCCEALIRWFHPEQGMISPGDFIPIAEETGLIVAIDHWSLKTACIQTKKWVDRGINIVTAVNLSGITFNQEDVVAMVKKALEESQLNPKYLEIELTESEVVKTPDRTQQLLKELQALGISLALDDFGTGYSSLSYLTRFSFNTLKIDQSFIHNLNLDEKNATIIMTTIDMAHRLNLNVVAEGVETDAELNCLQDYTCDLIQGYLFSRPLTSIGLEKLLEDHVKINN